MQKKLYDSLVDAIGADLHSKSVQDQVQLAQRIYESNINDLKQKHEQNIKETVDQFSRKWESLYAYIKEAERLLDEMDVKRKRERKDLQYKYQQELNQVHESYKSQIVHLQTQLTRAEIMNVEKKIVSPLEIYDILTSKIGKT